MNIGEKVAPIVGPVLSMVARDPESGWDKFESGVETVGKDAWGAVQDVAPLVPDIASIAGKIARRDP